MTIDELLVTIQKTNPGMTKEKLICELKKTCYSSVALINTENIINSCVKSDFF